MALKAKIHWRLREYMADGTQVTYLTQHPSLVGAASTAAFTLVTQPHCVKVVIIRHERGEQPRRVGEIKA